MPRLTPLHLSLVKTSLFPPTCGIVLALAFEYGFGGIAAPSTEMMYGIAQVGVAIILGYVIEAVWMVSRLERTGDDREDWLGWSAGLGLSGLVAVVVAFLIGAHRAGGHANFLDAIGLGWVVSALFTLGVTVALQPVVVDRWSVGDDQS